MIKAYFQLVLSAFLYGFLVFGGKIMSMNDFSLMEVLIYPNLFVVLILPFFVDVNIKAFLSLPKVVLILYPLALIFCQLGQFLPLYLGMSVSLTVFLLYTQPLWTGLISTLFLKTPFTKTEGCLGLIILTGLFFLVAPWQDIRFSFLGIIWALIGGISLSVWVILTRKAMKSGVKTGTMIFFSNFSQTIPFILLLPLVKLFYPQPEISSVSFFAHELSVWGSIGFYALSIFILAPFLFYRSARRIQGIHLGLILLLEPVTATLLDVIFLHTIPTWNMFLGGVLILLGNLILIIDSSKKALKMSNFKL